MLLANLTRELLLTPLNTVNGIVEKKHTLPILSNILISQHNNKLLLLTTDLEIQIQSYVFSDNTDFEITVNAKKFSDILKAIPENSQLSIEQNDQRITLRSGKSKFVLQSLPGHDFPRLSVPDETPLSLTIKQSLLKNLLSQVQYAMGHQDIRYYLNGLYMIIENDLIKLISTDGHRLCYIEEKINHVGEPVSVIIPRKTIIELYKLLQNISDDLEIDIFKNQIVFNFNNILLQSKLIEGKFPDYNRVIPTSNTKNVMLKRSELMGCLQRAAILSTDKIRSVRFLLETNLLRILCNNSDQEEAEEQIVISYESDPLDLGYNINYLTDFINNTQAEELLFSFGDHNNSTTLIAIPEHKAFLYVVMPMRI